MKLKVVTLLIVLAAGCTTATAPTAPAGDSAPLRILLARHGQTEWNRIRRIQGQSNTDLDDTGRTQAAQLRSRIEGIPLTRVYSSALNRAVQTATIATAAERVIPVAGLNEQAVGKFEGAWLDGRDPAVAEEFQRRRADPEDALDGGESARQFYDRVCTTARKIVADNPSGTVLVVGHGGTNKNVVQCLLGLSAEQAAAFNQANDELYAIEITGGTKASLWKLVPPERIGK